MDNLEPVRVTFWERIKMAFRLVVSSEFAREISLALQQIKQGKPAADAPGRIHAPALALLSAFQREGRFIDFLQQDVSGYSDSEVGAAARVVHGGCRKVIRQNLELEPALTETEGTMVTVPKDFDAQRIRLTGNVAGEAPFAGTLKHHGWVAKEIHFPVVSQNLNPKFLAPAEVELT